MIGVFDSGIGGLTVLAALRRVFPQRNLLYLGDTARVPYGTRSPETVVRYSQRVASWLHQQNVQAIVVACNTATTHALPTLQAAGAIAGVPVFGVVDPGVQAALRVHSKGAIAVLGTDGTISGGAYQRLLLERAPGVPVLTRSCPLFVPLVEEGWIDGTVPEQIAEAYLAPLRGKVDTAILGCTHYPLLKPVIRKVLPGVTLVDSADATANAVLQALGQGQGSGITRYAATDHIERFQRVGATFLDHRPEPVEWVDLGAGVPPFGDAS
ncbi:MAG: glutamate racemase [Rhodobacterales bacterium]|nr:glutamate racemase [Rhodobacterales bacterium]